PLFLLLIVLSLFTGTFVQLFILFAIILIHEIGHYTLANHYQWHIQSIVLWVFGGVMKTTEATNRPIKEDIIVTVAGPLQHIWMLFQLLKYKLHFILIGYFFYLICYRYIL